MSVQVRSLQVRLGTFSVGPLTLATQAGSVTALVGPNGSGKTTMLRALAALQVPTHGTVAIDGTPLHAMRESQRPARVAFVAQRPAVPVAMTVRDVVDLGRLRLPADPPAVREAMMCTGVLELAHRPMEQLSEGQRHRVAVARALAQRNPALRLLAVDEPTASLDAAWSRALARLLVEVARSGVSVFVATHDLAFAAACCTHAVLLDGGRVASAGDFDGVMQPDALAGVFGVPFAVVSGVADRAVTLPRW